MEWRCEWCGKPHEENDPPCDECGHGSFERAVVPTGPEGDGETLLWICPECGREHVRNNPPCSRCGNMTLEAHEGYPEEPEPDDGGLLDAISGLFGGGADENGDGGRPDEGGGRPDGGDSDSDDGTVETPERRGDPTVWVCPECGREHMRNNPPCSRCGNMTLEPATQPGGEITDDNSAGYLDLITIREVALAAVIVLVLALFALGQAGVIDLPGAETGGPAAEDVPGESEQVGDLSLSAVENAYVSEFADRRQAAGELPVGPDPRLADTAGEYNRWLVATEYGDEDAPDFGEVYEGECPWSVRYSSYTAQVGDTDELGTMPPDEVAILLLDAYEDGGGTVGNGASTIGVDVHVAPDGNVYVTHVLC